MIDQLNPRTLDIALFTIANFVHILIAVMFIARARGLAKFANTAGNVSVGMILPLGAAVILNSLTLRDWWMIVLPAFLLAFLVIELILDYILKLDFRNTRLLWPYLLLYYLASLSPNGLLVGPIMVRIVALFSSLRHGLYHVPKFC